MSIRNLVSGGFLLVASMVAKPAWTQPSTSWSAAFNSYRTRCLYDVSCFNAIQYALIELGRCDSKDSDTTQESKDLIGACHYQKAYLFYMIGRDDDYEISRQNAMQACREECPERNMWKRKVEEKVGALQKPSDKFMNARRRSGWVEEVSVTMAVEATPARGLLRRLIDATVRKQPKQAMSPPREVDPEVEVEARRAAAAEVPVIAASMEWMAAYTAGRSPTDEERVRWAAQGMTGTAAERLRECKEVMASDFLDICDAHYAVWLEFETPVDLELDALGPPPEAE